MAARQAVRRKRCASPIAKPIAGWRTGRNAGARHEGKGAVVGALVLNRFELRERLGSGGFGTVYRGWDERLQREVAVKVIDIGGQPLDRVLREAQAVGRLNHPSVVTLYELGEDGRNAYLVSELVKGATLAQRQRDGSLSDHDVGVMAQDLCAALEHAHSRGVVHRDIKPQNVLLADERRAKLMDFGIARVLDGAGITASGDVVGTLAYMAPEQAEGEAAGTPADVYSLALTLYEAWTGENPNARSTPAATARAIGTPITSLADLRAELPQELCDTVDAALDRDPELRPHVTELGEAIEDCLPELADDRRVPQPRRRLAPFSAAASLISTEGPAELAGAGAVAGLSAAAMFAMPADGPVWAYALPPAAGLLTLFWARLGYLLGAIGTGIWMATAAGRPGAALLFALLALPPALLVAGGRALPLPVASPLLGLAGAAPVYPVLAGLATRTRDRLVLGIAGYAWLAVVESSGGRRLLFGPAVTPPPGWQESGEEALRGFILPMLADPVFWLGLVLWSASAVALGLLVRGRNPALDLLGALIWSAVLAAALRLAPESTGPSPAVFAIAVLLVVAAVVFWRAREASQAPQPIFGPAPAPLQEAGREATLP
jgi:hypothetical protein